mmetsp:Transcript_24381/g.38603  ORF Transcript_24381/g.38603 Transcript_24381/m.38603 type:complete len:245 (-) Transcript_24381:102-836(-)
MIVIVIAGFLIMTFIIVIFPFALCIVLLLCGSLCYNVRRDGLKIECRFPFLITRLLIAAVHNLLFLCLLELFNLVLLFRQLMQFSFFVESLDDIVMIHERILFVLILQIIDGVHQIHLILDNRRFVLQCLDRVGLNLLLLFIEYFLHFLLHSPRFKIARTAMFRDIMVILGIGQKCHLLTARTALQIKAPSLQSHPLHSDRLLLPSIELCATAHIFTALCTTDRHRQHRSHFDLIEGWTLSFRH